MDSNLSIIPDHVLEANTCRICDKYLTVGPITVHPEGGNNCGRCHRYPNTTSCLFECDSMLDQISIPYAIFGYMNHLFPCVNRYEGCDKLLPFHEISSHERGCHVKTIKCSYCKDYEGGGSQQLHHFRNKHPANLFDKIHFRFPLDRRFCTKLIKRGNNLFFLSFVVDSKSLDVRFKVKPVRGSLEDDVDFFCLIKDAEDGEVVEQTTLTKRRADGIDHTIRIKNVMYLNECKVFCNCLLRRVSVMILQKN